MNAYLCIILIACNHTATNMVNTVYASAIFMTSQFKVPEEHEIVFFMISKKFKHYSKPWIALFIVYITFDCVQYYLTHFTMYKHIPQSTKQC